MENILSEHSSSLFIQGMVEFNNMVKKWFSAFLCTSHWELGQFLFQAQANSSNKDKNRPVSMKSHV